MSARLQSLGGQLLKPDLCAFSVSMSGNQALGSSTSLIDVQFNTEHFDTTNDFNTSNYTFTAPVGGIYFLSLNINFAHSSVESKWLLAQIVTTQRTISSYHQATAGDSNVNDYVQITIAQPFQMDAGDTAKGQVRKIVSTDLNVFSASCFSGYFIG